MVYGESDWKVKKHDLGGKCRVSRKLFIVSDSDTHETIVVAPNLSNVTDAKIMLNLIK